LNGGAATLKLVAVGRSFRGVVLAAVLCACGGDAAGRGPDMPELRPAADAGEGSELLDRDRDGLCDVTEAELGTDPDAVDTDADGLPDVIELVSGHEPALPDDPASEQLAYLAGDRGAAVDFEARFTVDGDGQALTGRFGALGTLYRDGDTAEHYFTGATALEAAPIDAARGIERDAARFDAVLGRTRLSFQLHFELADQPGRTCARAYPFRYSIKSDDGETRAERAYLLVIGQSGASTLVADAFCLPTGCD
jgi:hypothetical protein